MPGTKIEALYIDLIQRRAFLLARIKELKNFLARTKEAINHESDYYHALRSKHHSMGYYDFISQYSQFAGGTSNLEECNAMYWLFQHGLMSFDILYKYRHFKVEFEKIGFSKSGPQAILNLILLVRQREYNHYRILISESKNSLVSVENQLRQLDAQTKQVQWSPEEHHRTHPETQEALRAVLHLREQEKKEGEVKHWSSLPIEVLFKVFEEINELPHDTVGKLQAEEKAAVEREQQRLQAKMEAKRQAQVEQERQNKLYWDALAQKQREEYVERNRREQEFHAAQSEQEQQRIHEQEHRILEERRQAEEKRVSEEQQRLAQQPQRLPPVAAATTSYTPLTYSSASENIASTPSYTELSFRQKLFRIVAVGFALAAIATIVAVSVGFAAPATMSPLAFWLFVGGSASLLGLVSTSVVINQIHSHGAYESANPRTTFRNFAPRISEAIVSADIPRKVVNFPSANYSPRLLNNPSVEKTPTTEYSPSLRF